MSTFVVGSKVVHPCYGAGTVVRIQDKSISERSHSYYVINTVARSMQIMVPVQRAEDVGLRGVGEAGDLRETLSACHSQPEEERVKGDLRARQAEMRDRLKSGSFFEVADVVRVLYYLNSHRPLGTVDRQLYDQGKEFLASELSLALDVASSAAMDEVVRNLDLMVAQDV
jgi:CarD family transcriptional regulator